MTYRQTIGRQGEDLACVYLAGQGYEIVERNWRCPRGEIDVVAREDGCWAFVEVKTRRGHRAMYPEDALTATKLSRLVELAETYLARAQQNDVDWRIDLVAIELSERSGAPRINLVRAVSAT
jgi:putative endonuclease